MDGAQERNHEILIRVNVERQTAELIENGEVVASYPVSTSRFGLGFEEGSHKTPTGQFRISEKIGDGLPLGAVLKSRQWTGEIWPNAELFSGREQEDMILSRILWLEGLEEENANTKQRYIYFHGTNQEERVGTPQSVGCIRLRNQDMMDLFSRVTPGTRVEIT